MINENEQPLVSQVELYDKYNKNIKGEIGIIPRDNNGNIIKINITNDNINNHNHIINKNEYKNNINKNINISNSNENIDKKREINDVIHNNKNINKKYYPYLIKTKIKNNLYKIPFNKKNFEYSLKNGNNKSFINNKKYNRDFLLSSCFACDIGCGISRTGYSPMTYSPFNNRIKRKEETPFKKETKLKQYNKYKKLKIDFE